MQSIEIIDKYRNEMRSEDKIHEKIGDLFIKNVWLSGLQYPCQERSRSYSVLASLEGTQQLRFAILPSISETLNVSLL